jgi:glycine/D-amino acid oxidase-like deaminating enzyme/bacterioferritin-associated ferredoxin
MSRLDDKQQQSPNTTRLMVDGEAIRAVPGESIAAALTAAGRLKLHEDRHGAARGLFCGMGVCFECRISVNNGPAQRACLTKVTPGMKVRTLRYKERLPDRGAVPEAREAEVINCDVLIVGAGPAGMSAALVLAEADMSVVVVDERQDAGGQYFKQRIDVVAPAPAADTQYRDGAVMIESLRESGARLISAATVWGAFRDATNGLEICATTEACSYQIRPKQLIVASGAYESAPPFPGWTLPGVMTTGAAQSLVRAYRVGPAKKVLIAGNGPLNLQLACELINGGVNVVAVAESSVAAVPYRLPAALGMLFSSPQLCWQGLNYLRDLRKHGVPLYYAHHIVRAGGNDVVENGTIAKIDSRGEVVAGKEKTFDIDAICLGYTLQPSGEILRTLGCKQRLGATGVLIADRDSNGQTNIPGVFSIGDGAVLGGARVAMEEGRLAASALLNRPVTDHDRRQLNRHRKFQRSLWATYRAPDVSVATPDTLVCRCESVSRHTITSLIDSGVHDFGTLKRMSRAGMGVCQGRYCQKTIARLLVEATGKSPGDTDLFVSRVPVKPVTIGTVAAEKPEWLGFSVIDIPQATPVSPATSESLADTDVLIIGAGIIGVSTAMYLSREGVEVMLVDRGVSNSQASGGNAGSLHLQLLPCDFSEECSDTNTPAAVTLQLQKLGIETWLELEEEMQADFELKVSGGIMLADSISDLRFLYKKAALEERFGIEVNILSGTETRNMIPAVADHVAGAAFYSGEGKINPLTATAQLMRAAQNDGAVLQESCSVRGIDYSRGKFRVSTDLGVITCDKVINAAGAWADHVVRLLGGTLPIEFAPQQMHVTQAVEPVLPYLLSVAKRHLTAKQTSNGNFLIGGGWPAAFDAVSNLAVASRDSIEGDLWVAQHVLPQLGGLQMIRSWGAMGVMIDGAPIIGEMPGHPGFFNVVAANGYTMGPILGRIVADLTRTGQSDVDIAPFSLERFH